MKTLSIKTSTSSYCIYLEKGLLSHLSEYLDLKHQKVMLISDDGIPSSYIQMVLDQCNQAYTFIFKQGEESKSIQTYQQIMQSLIAHSFSRQDIIIALGGGVVGDLSGFIASTYLRGIAFYNIPTTLLSQVDSSIGGKTAINFEKIKNMIGSFYPPKGVFIDPNVLNTLSLRQFYSGLVEAFKMGLTCNASLCDLILNSNHLKDDIEEIIYQSLLIKKRIVEADEKENGLRKILNFGHTLGHVFEAHSQGQLLHGEAVGIGMLYFVSDDVKTNVLRFLKQANLPTHYFITKEETYYYLSHDKKSHQEKIDVIQVNQMGSANIETKSIQEIIQLIGG